MMDKTTQQKSNKEYKKKGKDIILLCLAFLVILGITAQSVQKTEATSQEDAAISCAESILEQLYIIQAVLEEQKADQTDQVQQMAEKPADQASQETEDLDPNIRYQMNQPCHFLMFIDNSMALDIDAYRNINTEVPLDSEGAVDIKQNRWLAYIADTVLDRYIREYGGKDALYTVRWASDELPEDCKDLCAFEICGEDITIKVIYSHRTGIENVTIENLDGARPRPEEYRHYADGAGICNSRHLYYKYDEKVYCKVIDPGQAGKVQCFRNVGSAAGAAPGTDDLIYYIADQAVDRYIRDFKGESGTYQVTLTGKEPCPEGGNTYEIQAECGNALLLIKYSDNSWVAVMEAQDEELDIGTADQNDIIYKVGRRNKLKKLKFTIDKYLYLRPITRLTNLEELSLFVATDKYLNLSPIGELTQLKKLSMHETTRRTHEVSYFLKKLKELEYLSVGNFKVDDLSFLRELTQLKNLYVSYVEDADFSCLESAAMLEGYLEVRGYHIRNTEVLAKAEKLHSITLWEMEKDPQKRGSINMETFSQMKELESMTIVRLRVEDLAPISGLQNLEELTLVDTGIGDIRCLASLSNIRELKIYGENAEQLKEQAEKNLTNVQSIYIDEKVPEQLYYFID